MDGTQTNIARRVGVAESPEPAGAQEDTQAPPLSLKQRLAAIRDECAGIGKQDITMRNQERTKEWTIKGHTFEAVLSEIRPLFAKHGVDMTPNLIERTYAGNRCDVIVEFEFVRTDDSEETKVIRWGGAGTDNGDKAFAKAGTNAVKEMLKKRFLVTDRDDAKEETESVEHQPEGGVSVAKLEASEAQRMAAQTQWAKAVKLAAEKAATKKDIDKLQKDNREQLAAVPEVTRTFLIDLFERRKAELP